MNYLKDVIVEDLTYRYSRGMTLAIDRLSVTVSPGRVFCLLGPNGAGKTTLLKILATLIIPTSGRAYVCGLDVVADPCAVRARLGFSNGEDRSFYYRLTGYQNLEFFSTLSGFPRATLLNRIKKVSEELELSQVLHRPYMKYSLGEKKKLSIARVLVSDADVFLFDEPNSGVDPASALIIRTKIKDLAAAGKTVIVTTHHLDEVVRFGDVISILNKGRLVVCDSLQNIQETFGGQTIRLSFRKPDDALLLNALMNAIINKPDVSPITLNGAIVVSCRSDLVADDLMRWCLNNRIRIVSVQQEKSSLEEIYLKLTYREN